MEKTKFKLEFSLNEKCENGIPVIIVAAGSSTRMGGINKQTAQICGVPVIARTLMNFNASANISEITLVVRDEDIMSMQILVEKYSIDKLTDIVAGGSNRQESVLNGLKRIKEAENILIHDGARPLTDKAIIAAVADALEKYSAVTCAVPLKDTVKQIDKNGKVVATPNRSELVAVQTPQGVRINDYLKAIESAGDLSSFTDDMSIMEAAGFEAYTVAGSYKNIKITTPEDLKLAEYFLEGETEE